MNSFVGVDGCPGGWVAVAWAPEPGRLACEVLAAWCDLRLSGAMATAVDMPIGLSDLGPRDCDLAARRRLPAGRKSSVFPAPRRYMLDCATWREAQDEGRAREGVGLSVQAWNIVAKIREIDCALSPADQECVFEAHPELIFFELSGRRTLPPKRTRDGLTARLALLQAAGLRGLERQFGRFPAARVKPDDIVDAAACALAARRIHAGNAVCLPSDPPRDSRGLRMEIWY